jgi:hypothetical protein
VRVDINGDSLQKRLARVQTLHRRSAARVLETVNSGPQQAAGVDDLAKSRRVAHSIQGWGGPGIVCSFQVSDSVYESRFCKY